MWRFIVSVVILFISAFIPSSGNAQPPIQSEDFDDVQFLRGAEFGKFNSPGFTCENGFIQLGQFCREVVSSYFDCEEFTGSDCVENMKYCSLDDLPSSSYATLGCREGYVRQDGRDVCIGEDDLGEPDCPEGCIFDGQCRQIIPAGFVCTGSRTEDCLPTYHRSSSSDCPSSFTKELHGTDVHCRWNGSSDRYCDYISLGDNECVSNNSPCTKASYCRRGVLKNNRCMEAGRRSVEFVCPKIPGGRPNKLRFVCREGEMISGECRDFRYKSVVRKCPSNYILRHDDKCISLEKIPATATNL